MALSKGKDKVPPSVMRGLTCRMIAVQAIQLAIIGLMADYFGITRFSFGGLAMYESDAANDLTTNCFRYIVENYKFCQGDKAVVYDGIWGNDWFAKTKKY